MKLVQSGLGDAVYFMPPNSLHMTICGIDHDPQLTAPITQAQYLKRYEQVKNGFSEASNLGKINARVEGMGFAYESVITLKVQFENINHLNKIEKVRENIAKYTGVDLNDFVGKVTFAQTTKKLSPQQLKTLSSIINEYSGQRFGNFSIDSVELAYFSNMLYFVPALRLDLETGSVNDLKFDLSLLNNDIAKYSSAKNTNNTGFNTYGALAPTKWLQHEDRVQKIIEGKSNDIVPVTVHLVPTLRCDHLCYFCTYGGAKGNKRQEDNRPVALQPKNAMKDMPFENMKDTLDKLSSTGVRGVIFTGGGEADSIPAL